MSDERFRLEYQDARRIIRADLGESLFVEAGAGTGKTSALVDRIAALVAAGTPIDRIVAITFTEKAAAELKDRVRGALEQMLVEGVAEEATERALESLDRAQISTIHAFGLSLMRRFSAEARTDPAFDVQDEILAERRFEERWRSYLASLGAEATASGATDRLLGLGLNTQSLQMLAVELGRLPGLAPELMGALGDRKAVVWPDIQAFVESLAALPLEVAPPGDKLRRRAEAILSLARRIARAGDEHETVLAGGVAEIAGEIRQISNRQAWGTYLDDVRSSLERVRTQLTETLEACRTDALMGVLPCIARFVEEDTANRRREGTLVFDDLILGPRDLLRSPRAQQALRERYDVLLIDEFQDTDPLQVEIALAFAIDPDTSRMEPGRLFVVGDPKQSIYRFRRADMAVYEQTRGRVEAEGGRFLTLGLNHRSRPEIVDWVNRVFGRLIGEGGRPEIQPRYRPIHADRRRALEGPGVATIGGVTSAPARDMRQTEARAIVATCMTVRKEWEVEDRTTGQARPATFRDMAILIPTRAGLTALERALQDGCVPYRVEGGSLIYQTQEVRDLINCLAAIDDPADGVAVVGALRSAAFGCSDVELTRFRLDGGRFNYHAPDLDDRQGPVAEGLRTLARYHGHRHDGSLASLVEQFVAERGLDEAGILVQADRDSFRRMRFVVEQARKFEAARPESLRAFVAWMERRTDSAGLDMEGAGLDDDEDAVRILTVHGAKGLEFPIVFMAGLSWSPSNRYPVFVADRADGHVAVRIGAKTRNNVCEAGDVARIHATEQKHTQAEFTRLLYVAATRARDHLIVSLYHQRANSAARKLMDAGAAEDVTVLPEATAAPAAQRRPFTDLRVEPPDSATDEEFAAARETLVQSARTTRYESATSLGRAGSDREAREDESEPWKRGRGATSLGRAVHATIQSVRLDAMREEIEAASRAQAVAEAIPQRAADVARLARAALDSVAARRARLARRALREVPFAARVGDTIIEGFVDLVLETEDGIEIVDWKTDDIPAAGVEERLSQYRLQAGLYVAGIEAATGRQAHRVTYVFASAGVEASPGEPAALAEAALSRLNAP